MSGALLCPLLFSVCVCVCVCSWLCIIFTAGRRGLDDKGIVIQMVDEKLEPAVAKDMLKGASDPLNSTFHLGYNMLLNLYRVEAANPETMIISSFAQFQNDVCHHSHLPPPPNTCPGCPYHFTVNGATKWNILN
eukprot:COSAG05_NODE_864_length_6891_cov_387.780330_7_plen_134_part_00